MFPDLKAPEGPLVWTAEMGTDPQGLLEPRVTEASLDTQVSWEKMAFKDLRVFLDVKATAAEGETLVVLEDLEVLETQDTPDTRDLEVRPESV